LRSWALGGSAVTEAVALQRQEFESRFEEAFGLAAKGINTQQRNFAMSTMSNLIGGTVLPIALITCWYGRHSQLTAHHLHRHRYLVFPWFVHC
jgi:hypothetical protein